MYKKPIISPVIFLLFIMIPFTQAQALGIGTSGDICRIVSPVKNSTIDYYPVKITIRLENIADASTFKAWLNGTDITGRFKPAAGRLEALVMPEDGLRCRVIGEDSRLSKVNILTTWVRGAGISFDLDLQEFSVEYYPVATTRDDKGVWFITGGCLSDVFEALGYAIATDRLWQIETYRRSARGRLAEIFGPSQLSTDVFMRTIGYSDQQLTSGYESLDLETRIILDAYTDGINNRIDEIRDNPALLPFEFGAIGLSPAYWTPEDVLAWEALMLREFDCEALEQGQVQNAALLQKLTAVYGQLAGYGMFNDLRWINDPDALTYIQPAVTSSPLMAMAAMGTSPAASTEGKPAALKEVQSYDYESFAQSMADRLAELNRNLSEINARVHMGSYAWVVSGSKTADHKPIIYSGPQMGFSVPSIVCEGSIMGGGLQISGMSVPGLPGIVIGRTPHHAWSMQVGHAHTTDYYFESPSDPKIVLDRIETITVAGSPSYQVQIPVYRSSHGPIVSPMPFNPATYIPSPATPIVSWKYSHEGYEFQTIKAYLDFARAQSMDEFGKAIEGVAVSQHFCYADRDGNIAYWMSGRDPQRPAGDWRVPQGMLGMPLEWDASNLIARSTDKNNPRGYYCGWNNKSNPSYNDPPNSLSYLFGPFHRAHVIDDYLSMTGNLSFDDVRNLALSIATTDSFGGGGNPWEFVKGPFADAVRKVGPTPDRQAGLDLLNEWDGHFVDGGPEMWAFGNDRADAWVLMNAWIREVLRLTFADELTMPGESADGSTYAKEQAYRLFNVMLHSLAGSPSGVVNSPNWFANLKDPSAPQTSDTIIVQALDTVSASLSSRPWGNGTRGRIAYNHSMLGEVWIMPFSSRSTYAHCVEMGRKGPVRIESMFPLGESGDILADSFGMPVFDDDFFSMTLVFDLFAYRSFPLFK